MVAHATLLEMGDTVEYENIEQESSLLSFYRKLLRYTDVVYNKSYKLFPIEALSLLLPTALTLL